MRAVAIGIWGGVSGLGVALGPVVGGAVVEGVSWQAIFWLNVPVALVALPLLLVAVRESKGTWQRLDLVGTALLGGAVFLGIWGIVHGNDDGWSSTRACSARWSLAALLRPGVRRSGPAAGPTPCCRCGCSARAASRSPTSSG